MDVASVVVFCVAAKLFGGMFVPVLAFLVGCGLVVWLVWGCGVGFSTRRWWCCVCWGFGVCGVGWGCVVVGCGVGFSFAAAHGLPGLPGGGCGCVVVV